MKQRAKSRSRSRKSPSRSVRRPRWRAGASLRQAKGICFQQLREALSIFLPQKGLALLTQDKRLRWVDRMLVIAGILMVLVSASTARDAFDYARAVVVGMYPSRKRPGECVDGFFKRLGKRSAQLLPTVVNTLRLHAQALAGKDWRYRGWVVMAVDGTKIDCPRTQANETDLGCAGREGSAPQILLTAIQHLRTGLFWDWRRGGSKDSERGHLQQMLEALPSQTMLLADAGFVGYMLMKALMADGHDFVVRAGSNVTLIKDLGFAAREYDGIVYLWPQDKQREHPPLVLRMVQFKDGYNHTITLLTSVLDRNKLSDKQLLELYHQRWSVELGYRTLKQTMSYTKVHATTAALAQVQVDWAVVGMGLLSLLMVSQSGYRDGAIAGSPAETLRVLRNAMREGHKRCRRGGLAKQLAKAVKDTYERKSAKTRRSWPRKTETRPPGEPKMRMATKAQVRKTKNFIDNKDAA